MSQLKIFIYTTNPCGYCRMVKTLLDKKGVAYEEKMIFGGTPEWDEMVERTGGAKTVPQVFINDRGIGGYPELLRLQQSGELDVLLSGV